MPDLLLAAASLRLRGKPGRPRKHPIEGPPVTAGAPTKSIQTGAGTGTGRAQDPARTRVNGGSGGSAGVRQTPALAALSPRLLDLRAAAAYLGIAPWTVRELEWRGVLRRLRVPLPNGGELRKILFDREDLDRLVERWKDGTPEATEAGRGGRGSRG